MNFRLLVRLQKKHGSHDVSCPAYLEGVSVRYLGFRFGLVLVLGLAVSVRVKVWVGVRIRVRVRDRDA